MCSRLIVRNVPKHINDKRLRDHFSSQGVVTDVRIMKTRDGRSRQFAFIGYKTDAEAKRAKSHFNNTYVDTSRVTVEMAVKGGDSSLARPWSKHAPGSSLHAKANGIDLRKPNLPNAGPQAADRRRQLGAPVTIDVANNSDTAKLLQQVYSNDPQFQEFVQAHASAKKSAVWADGHQNTAKKKSATVRVAAVQSKKAGGADAPLLKRAHVTFGDDSSDDEMYNENAVAAGQCCPAPVPPAAACQPIAR